jgi:hypothetical protein
MSISKKLSSGHLTAYVYIRSEPQLWTVGFYDPQGKWQPESDHASSEEAAKRVHWLAGGSTNTEDE